MGEYIKLNGEEIKLGTCEDLYYVRLEQLKQYAAHMEALSGNLSASAYLDPANGFRYRFPFPQEDGTPPGDYKDYNYGLLIFLRRELAASLWDGLAEWEHGTIYHSCNYRHAVNVNIAINCPLSATPPHNMSQGGPSKAIVLSQQKQVDGEVWVVVSCPYCEAKVRLDRTEAAELAACAKTMAHDEENQIYWNEVAARIMAGYNQPES